jgi:hypothetical protein
MRSSAAASSYRSALGAALCLAPLLAGGCDVGSGTGSATGVVSAPGCGLDAEPFDLHPDFFTIDPIEGFAELRVQHGSEIEDRSDVLLIFVADTADVETSRLGEPIAVDLDASDGVSMSLALNETCHVDDEREDVPVNYIAVSGTITFSAIYAPSVDGDHRTAATFEDVRFIDPSDPDARYAVLSGDFDFDYSRKKPAQRFP